MKLQAILRLIGQCSFLIVLSSCQKIECPENLILEATQIQKIKTYNKCEATITGVVLNTHAALEDGTIFLNLGNRNYKQAFSVVIFKDSWSRFHNIGIEQPEKFYHNKNIAVEGLISQYQGRPQIIVESPRQIFLR